MWAAVECVPIYLRLRLFKEARTVAFIMTKSMYYVYYGAVEAAYFIGESWLSDWLGNYF